MIDAITTTLAAIRDSGLVADRYKKLCKALGGISAYGENTPISFRQIYESNGYDDTLWCLRTIDRKWDGLLRHFAVDCAEDVARSDEDPRTTAARAVARRYADGLATDEELIAADVASWMAVEEATTWAAEAAAWSTADIASEAATNAAATWVVVDAAAQEKQMARLFEYCRTGARPQ